MAEHTDEGIFREIDEDLRQEHYAKLWKKYGRYLVAGAIVFVAVVAGYQSWNAYDIKNRRELGERFANAQMLAAENKNEEAQAAFSTLAASAGGGYAMLARFRRAALEASEGGNTGGYRELAGDAGIDAIYRDLAQVLGAMHEADGADSRGLMDRLAPLTADDNPWRYSARELTAMLAMRSGDTDKARDILKGLSEDAAAPRGMRTRATELLAAIGG